MALAEALNSRPVRLLEAHRGMLLPIAATTLILVILIPLPTWLMDFLLALNITLSAVVLLTVMYTTHPLEFSVFPSLLLGMTLYRLVLNTATTRLILTNTDATTGTASAGRVIQAFGDFVARGSLAVGIIIFVIIVVIQFVVITKGATRIAEVAARFTLDGMPGKQMAIDADLNAGMINEEEARRRRQEITREADFYGAMDGASKFVRGDAIAGVIITVVNILGGVYVGMVEKNMGLAQCLETFTKLTIGDGLVAQIPAFIVSVAAGLLVTRSAAKANLGEELLGQLTAKPTALALAAGFLGLLALTPLPFVPLLTLGVGCGGLAWLLGKTRVTRARAEAAKAQAAEARKPERVESYLAVDPMELEVGYGLVKLVDRKQGGDLLDRITMIRRQIALDLGIVVPPIRIRDNMTLEPNQYGIKLRGVEVARGETLPGYLLAINSGAVQEPMHGIETTEPAFGLPALWVDQSQRASAEYRNYTVVEPSGVIATHLTEIIRRHADELLTRQEVNRLLENLKQRSPKAVEEVVPELLKAGDVQRVLQNLLRERVPIRDLETILETLGDWAGRTKDLEVLTEYARNALARTICQQHRRDDNTIQCITLDPQLEDLINSHIERKERQSVVTMPPGLQNRICGAIRKQLQACASALGGQMPAILCSPQVRAAVRRILEPVLPHVAVLAYNEIVKSVQVQSRGMVVLSDEPQNVPSAVHS
jgi:flagellar biosynthesis protein FlhA